MFDRSKLESLCDVSVTRTGYALSQGFPQTVLKGLGGKKCITLILKIGLETFAAKLVMWKQTMGGCHVKIKTNQSRT